ncbi:MAG: hypothetical protein AAB456_00550 [Patescibacteria group bacterium]
MKKKSKKSKKLGIVPEALVSTKKKLWARDYANRGELEIAVSKLVSLTSELKDYELIGTRKELNKLHLSDTTVFYGINCVITDMPTVAKAGEKPFRGERFQHGINLNQ